MPKLILASTLLLVMDPAMACARGLRGLGRPQHVRWQDEASTAQHR